MQNEEKKITLIGQKFAELWLFEVIVFFRHGIRVIYKIILKKMNVWICIQEIFISNFVNFFMNVHYSKQY